MKQCNFLTCKEGRNTQATSRISTWLLINILYSLWSNLKMWGAAFIIPSADDTRFSFTYTVLQCLSIIWHRAVYSCFHAEHQGLLFTVFSNNCWVYCIWITAPWCLQTYTISVTSSVSVIRGASYMSCTFEPAQHSGSSDETQTQFRKELKNLNLYHLFFSSQLSDDYQNVVWVVISSPTYVVM